MSLLEQYKNASSNSIIDITDTTSEYDKQVIQKVYEEFECAVTDTVTLLEHESNPILSLKTSLGKDSSITLLIALEAYVRFIAKHPAHKNRLLSISTVNTQIESIPMNLYVGYTKNKIVHYAKMKGINIQYDLVSPKLENEFFIKYASGDKLLNNGTRSGDCTNILKLDPMKESMDLLRHRIGDNQQLVSYVGSRISESSRRSGNMETQGIRDKNITCLISDIDGQKNKKKKEIIDYAPIRSWSDNEVFTGLRIAGSDAVWKSEFNIPSFFPHSRLLLEIYGNGSGAETCEINTSGAGGQGCSGTARYGCTLCNQIVTEKSGVEASKYQRWEILGSERALRVRDWMFRVSMDVNARSLHAKAYDPVFNRVILQPNILKTDYLIKMVRLASQLTNDSIDAAENFKELLRSGREMEHPGYKEIQNDETLHPKCRSEFLNMYRSEAVKPQTAYFSLEHAVLLSFKWALEGVSSLPFEPLSVWSNTCNDIDRIPYPKLNSEMDEEVKLISQPVPEARVLRTYNKKHEKNNFWQDDFLSLWQPDFSIAELLGQSDCSRETGITHRQYFQCTAKLKLELLTDCAEEHGIRIASAQSEIIKIKHKGSGRKVELEQLADELSDMQSYINELCEHAMIHEPHFTIYQQLKAAVNCDDKTAIKLALKNLTSSLSKKLNLSGNGLPVPLAYFDSLSLDAGVQLTGRKRHVDGKKKRVRSERNIKRLNSKIVRTTSKLRFYKPNEVSALTTAHQQQSIILTPSFDVYDRHNLAVFDLSDDENSTQSKIMINQSDFDTSWIVCDSLERALDIHSKAKRSCERKNISEYNYNNFDVVPQMMRWGGLMVHPSYYALFEKKLRRTGIMRMLNAYDFQNLTLEEVDAKSGVLTMKQHRSDKAAYLLRIRAKRAADRQRTKNRIAALKNETYSTFALDSSLNKVEIVYQTAIEAIEDMAYHIALPYPGESISNAHRAKINRTWLNFYNKTLTNPELFLKSLMSNEELHALSGDHNATQVLNKSIYAHGTELLAKAMVNKSVVGITGDNAKCLDNLITNLNMRSSYKESKAVATSKISSKEKANKLSRLMGLL